MKPFDWLRLGGMIARKWSDIDFETVEIEPTTRSDFVIAIIPLDDRELLSQYTEGDPPQSWEYEREDIELQTIYLEGQYLRVGYGPKSKKIAIYYLQKPPWWDKSKHWFEDLKAEV